MTTPSPELGRLLTAARERAGLSRRQLALELGVSASTVIEAEKGGNPRASTLERYLEVLPWLSPHALLQASGQCAPSASPAAWAFHEACYGVSAESLSSRTRVDAAGRAETKLEVKGLRSQRSSLRDPIERTAVLRMVCQGSAATIRGLVKYEQREPKGRLTVPDENDVRHEYGFPSALDRVGMSYRCTKKLPALPGARKDPPKSTPVPFTWGVHAPIRYPIKLLEIEVRFPGKPPAEAVAHAWVRSHAVEPGDPNLVNQLHPDGLDLNVLRNGLRLIVEQPLIGLEYGIGWDTP